ncbi:transglycosylase SLT domain-containing protein [Pseudomonas luteola]|uniref:transglycosylase SLT domain-containing protein n=1 Tax=Pseudomonas TaxID=286 RepID=UPI00388E38CC
MINKLIIFKSLKLNHVGTDIYFKPHRTVWFEVLIVMERSFFRMPFASLRAGFLFSITLCAGCQLTDSVQLPEARAPRLVIREGQEPVMVSDYSRPPMLREKRSDIWGRVSSRFVLVDQIGRNDRINQQLNWLIQNRRFITNASGKAAPYLHFIVEGLEQKDLPAELALLPMIESAYDPMAISSQKAVGLWQFMPRTGTDFGLRQTSLYDARRDVIASTHAAMRYLTRLHQQFGGDWLLALAAYNAGEGTVSRLIEANRKKGLPTDYWHLDLPRETQNYVPRLLALSILVKSPHGHAIELKPVADEPYFITVRLARPVELAQLALISGIPKKELQRLNPAYVNGNTIGGPGHLVIPIAKERLLTANLDTLARSDGSVHTSEIPTGQSTIAATP